MRSARRRSWTVIPLNAFLHQRPEPHEPIVDAHEVEKQQDDDAQDDPADHVDSPPAIARERA